VAEPCIEIAEDDQAVYKYTAKGNLVGVISNGTAVLGLGNIGPEASKPVMEGKGVLFKKFAGIDVFDIEIDAQEPKKFIEVVKALEPTFGGINLEDIKAPESFEIEETLRREMNIPIMHDDQHGTAIISSAALLSALELVQKNIQDIRIVVSGAGAAAIACSNLYVALGARRENIVMTDSKGVIRSDRANLDKTKAPFATDLPLHTLQEAMKGADMFLGLSVANVLTPEDILAMGNKPIVFALANPDPEISYELAMKTRPDIIMATGRSDHPNQVNNVLGFPYIFRGALDVRATIINEEMKLAAVRALTELAKEAVPEMVIKAYGGNKLAFGKDYLIPKPLDPRLITTISPAVAKAAMDSGVAKVHIEDWPTYQVDLQQRVGIDQRLMQRIISRAKKEPKRIVFAEADNYKILKAVEIVKEEGIGIPILLGNHDHIHKLCKQFNIDLSDCRVIDTMAEDEKTEHYGSLLYDKRKRKGLSYFEGKKLMRDRNYFGAMMVEMGDADALISGLTKDYARTIKPALQVIGTRTGTAKVAGMYIMSCKTGNFIFADTTVNTSPDDEGLVNIIELTVHGARFFDIEPRIAVLSYSNFGSSEGEVPTRARRAVEKVKAKYPDLVIDGDIQANTALSVELQREHYPFSELAKDGANTLIFPDLASGNIAYKLLMELGGAEAIGPILLGMKKPVHILQLGSSVREIVNMVSIAVVDAQAQTEDQHV